MKIYAFIRDGQFKSRFLQKRLEKRAAEMGAYVKAFMTMMGGARLVKCIIQEWGTA